ncbi:MAG TPA: NAD(P)H-dependent oxidoreductase [Steroidobacteraceae bacterium]
MKHLIVVAHPLEDSVTMKLARAYALELSNLGHDCVMHDLYRLGFDPVMGAVELEPLSKGQPAPGDVREAQAAVAACDVLTALYPLWWASMPAMMKGYIDRVFARGFAYEANAGATRGLLAGRRCVLVTLSGSPLSLLHANGEWKAIELLQDLHIFRSSGFEMLEHLHFDLVEPPNPRSVIAAHIDRVRDCARRHFADVSTGPPERQADA